MNYEYEDESLYSFFVVPVEEAFTESPYVIETLSWTEVQKQAWFDGLANVIVDMYVDAENLQAELPIFER